MPKINIFFKVVVLCLFCFKSFAQNDSIARISDTIQSDSLTSTLILSNFENTNDTISSVIISNIYNPQRDPKRLLYNTGMYAGVAVASFGLLWIAPVSISKWDKQEIQEEGLLKKWKENVKEGPVFDEDEFFMNYVIHPWAGGVYYMTARGSGATSW